MMSSTDRPDREDREYANGVDLSERELSTIADLFVLVSRCFEPPDEEFHAALDSGAFETQLGECTDTLDLDTPSMPDPGPLPEMRRAHRRSFEAYDGPYAPPVESVYEEWWDGTHREILSGPTAHDMRSRYEAIDAEIPDQYPPDHISLLLEYGSLLLEAGERSAYMSFHDQHFDWIDAFRSRIDDTCDDQFYRWAIAVLDEIVEMTRSSLEPSGGDVQ